MAKIDIYTRAYCPFCVKAKALLQKKNVTFKEIKIDHNPALVPEMLTRSKGKTSVPQIFINDTHVGGCDDLFALHATNDLDPLLNA